MTEEEALEKIEEIKQKYYDYNHTGEVEEVPSSALKSLLDIAIQQPEGRVPHLATLTCHELIDNKPRRRLLYNDTRCVRRTLEWLRELIAKRPDLKEKALLINDILFDKISTWNFDNFTSDQFGDTFQSLSYAVKNNPKLVDTTYKTFKTIMQANHFNNDSLVFAYPILERTVVSRPELAEEVFPILKTAIMSDRNSKESLDNAYDALYEIVEAQPQLASQVFRLVKDSLQDISRSAPVSSAFWVLSTTVQAQPSLATEALKLIENKIQNASLDFDYIYRTQDAIKDIIVSQPQYSEKAFELFNYITKSEKNDKNSLLENYCRLQEIVEARPQLTGKVFDAIKIGLQSQNNDEVSISTAYDILKNVAESQPEFLDKIVEAVEIGVKHSKNSWLTFEDLGEIVQKQPLLLDKFTNIISSLENEDKIYFYRKCIKNFPLEESIKKYPEIEQDLRLVHKARFTSTKEFMYALEHFDKAKLADSMIFSAQQRVMNVLVSTSAQEEGITREDAINFRKPDAPEAVKDYMKNNNDWLIPASFKGAAIFKEYFPAYIKTIQNHNQKNPEDKLSIHDAVYWLPEPMSKEANFRFAQFIQKNIIYQTVDENGKHKNVHRPLEELNIIAKNWQALENKLAQSADNTDITKLKYNDVLSMCMSVIYEDQRNDLFAVEAAKHGTPEAEYHNCEDIYLAGLKVPEPFDSKKEFKDGKYVGRFLPRDDPRTLFFGDYTNCCQHYGSAGHSCAISTVKHPFSQLFVIEDDKGKIIAGSWTWENTEGKYREVCFDNIESLGELKRRPEINNIYEQVGNYLTKEQNCRRVTIGLGFQDADVSGYEATESIKLPKLYGNDGTGSYSDARSQVLLAENSNAQLLDKTQESQRYIRDVCFLDMEAMDKVSEAVFPDGDKQLQAPENMSGFVIEDREKGVVGYCLYDIEEKSIYDMAVLPEYRTDKNASSRKLFAEMMRVINKEGGEWSAEMRDETTLRYLKVMAERGYVKYKEHGVDHVMSDGTKVVAVTFSPISEKVRQAKNRLKKDNDKEQVSTTEDVQDKTSSSENNSKSSRKALKRRFGNTNTDER